MKISNSLVSAFASTRLVRVAFGGSVCAVAIAFSSAVVPQSASAQLTESIQSPSNVTSQQNERDTFGQSGDFNVFNMIHRAQMGTGELTDPSQSISDAATKFRLEQQRQLNMPQPSGSQQQPKPGNQVTTSPVAQ
ncbi:MAG: hypothetical protein M3O33_15710 [Cyanobacteriota bacterium]|nr:hypothetical protein [Cyanobacteriota bacterium]